MVLFSLVGTRVLSGGEAILSRGSESSEIYVIWFTDFDVDILASISHIKF